MISKAVILGLIKLLMYDFSDLQILSAIILKKIEISK